MLRWILLIIFAIFLTACDNPPDTEQPSATTLNQASNTHNIDTTSQVYEPLNATRLLNEPTAIYNFETTTEALSIWRRAIAEKPTLLLLSNVPSLRPVPEALRKKAATLIHTANPDKLRLEASSHTPSPLLMPDMALDAAMRSNWFKEVVWALPLRDSNQELNLEKFKSQMIEAGLADNEELAGFSLTENIFKGFLRNIPFRAAALPLIKSLDGPVIVHIDLSYFQPLYKNEISTPSLDIIYQTMLTVQKTHMEVLAVTFSYGHLDSQIALDVRFLGDIIAYLVEDPARMEQSIPLNWQRQINALYLSNFLMKGEILEIYLAQEQDAPQTAWIKFNLYRSAVSHNEGAKALDYLAQAVKLDSVFALEYYALSNRAYNKQRPDEALHMLELAAQVFLHDPFLKLQMAQLANELGNKERALKILNNLRDLTWSKTYYPDMIRHLADLIDYVKTSKVAETGDTSNSVVEGQASKRIMSDPDTSRRRILHAD